MSVLIETTLGDLVVDLNVNLSPKTCENFLKLCKLKFYNNCEFYKIEKDFIARTGRSKKYGNSSLLQVMGNQEKVNTFFESEITPKLRHKKKGVLGMVNDTSKSSLGSEFYFTLKDDLTYLDGHHVIFAQVEEGTQVLSRLNEVITDEDSIPLQKVMILHTYILDDPFEDSPELLDIIPPDSPPEETDPLTKICQQDQVKVLNSISEREARSRAITLEILGDIPDADMKPPENVLFVCKLNPVTRDDDLELIFSRFGEVKSCDIIRDYKTGESLQYAFIEFETKQQCELAFMKMQNAVIDDRR
ncbi:cyclophilin-RNA interacting protein [Cryptosporidium ubiquitum]|uniref:peptidylprolyl isomerase n=1 Tax=Cryptosporidium ubiquitum TaxID=857276 RepID=A0A1J4MI20_9CRYT|nr:cyclophilin-RNA interacting protein [Cryptosporidium ubiquitum]OII73663.1 cyclophilin-RNA interacting protein [Cryptosporidium ubiquitum]